MRSASYLALFAGSAAAQSTVTLFNLYYFQSNATLTQIGSDATATTYKNDCPTNNAGISVIPISDRPTPDSPSATITSTPRARLARQASPTSSASSDPDDYDLCEPYTLKQGPSTWEFHLKDPLPGAWTVDANCKWQGAITAADLTCTGTADGYVVESTDRGAESTVLSRAEVSSMDAIQAYAVVTSTGSGSAAPSQTASGLNAASGSARPSTGLAPAGPLPTGAMALVGGAAGVFVAALAL